MSKSYTRRAYTEVNGNLAKYHGIPSAILPGAWTVVPTKTGEEGEYDPEKFGPASIDLERRVMNVPDTDHPSAWAARQHEWGHLEASPVRFGEAASKVGVKFATLNAAEDGRINMTKQRIFQNTRGRDCMGAALTESTRSFVYGRFEVEHGQAPDRKTVKTFWNLASERKRLDRLRLAVAKFGMWSDDEIPRVMKSFPVDIANEVYRWYSDWEKEDLSILGTPAGYGQAVYVAQRMEALATQDSDEEVPPPPTTPPTTPPTGGDEKGEKNGNVPQGDVPPKEEGKDDAPVPAPPSTGNDGDETVPPKPGDGDGDDGDDGDGAGDDGEGGDDRPAPSSAIAMPDFDKLDAPDEILQKIKSEGPKSHRGGGASSWISDDAIVAAVKGSEYYTTSKSTVRGVYHPKSWGPCKWVDVKLTKPLRKELRNSRGGAKPTSKMYGGMWRAHKILTTGEIYKRIKPSHSAAFCFDMSGSMSVTRQAIVDALEVCPRADIIGYCDSVLFYLARKGKAADWQALNRHKDIRMGNNGCDGEALDWLGKQNAQLKVWISDGGVHGNSDMGRNYTGGFAELYEETIALVGTYGIRQVLDLDEFSEGLSNGFRNYKPGVVTGVVAAYYRDKMAK